MLVIVVCLPILILCDMDDAESEKNTSENPHNNNNFLAI